MSTQWLLQVPIRLAAQLFMGAMWAMDLDLPHTTVKWRYSFCNLRLWGKREKSDH